MFQFAEPLQICAWVNFARMTFLFLAEDSRFNVWGLVAYQLLALLLITMYGACGHKGA